ncbi:hypothetical protein Ari01nite_96460 [Paractinoplanes rishiriensis]|uniref:Uncharacterized protein n=1 Tax=Paractinoplanes rishiriensis TaxID=1050105 RepID=A0A919K747_9ACTN|nr:hypothetical protein Ari01nite_96460 [Actinoplanes rishiriensis]
MYARATVLTPGPEDLAAIGVNLMDGRRRADALQTAQVTVPAMLRRDIRVVGRVFRP